MFAVITKHKVTFAEGTAAHTLKSINSAGITFDNGNQLFVIRAGDSQSIHCGNSTGDNQLPDRGRSAREILLFRQIAIEIPFKT